MGLRYQYYPSQTLILYSQLLYEYHMVLAKCLTLHVVSLLQVPNTLYMIELIKLFNIIAFDLVETTSFNSMSLEL